MADNPFDQFDDKQGMPIDEASGLPQDSHVPDSRLPVVPSGSEQAADHAPFTKDADGNLTFYNASGTVIGRKPINGPMEVDIGPDGAHSTKGPSSNPFDQFDNATGATADQKPPETTVAGLAGAATRGLAPVAAGALAGAGLGALAGGVGAVPGAAVGAAAAGLTQLVGDPLVGGINTMFGTHYTKPTDAMAHLLTDLGIPEPKTAAEKITEAMAQGAGMGLATAGLGSTLAAAPGVTGAVGETLAAAPASQALANATAFGSGEAAKEGGVGPTGQIAATLAGGLLPGALAAGGSGAARLAEMVAEPFSKAGATRRAGDILSKSITTSPEDVIANIGNAPAPVEGVAPTLAEQAGDAGLAGMQRGHANTNLNTSAAMFERNSANALARSQALKTAFESGSPQAIQDLAAQQIQQAESLTEAQQIARQADIDKRLFQQVQDAASAHAAARTGMAQAIEKLGPVADRDATGSVARDAYEQAYEGAKARSREAYASPSLVKPQPINIPRPVFMKLREAADDFYGDGGGEIPARLQSIIADMADQNATTRTLTNIDRRLADFAGEARMQGRKSEAAFADRIRGQLGSFVENAAPKAYRDALKEAKAIRAEQGRIFENGPVSSSMARDRYGNPVTGDNSLSGKLVRPGAAGGDAAESLIKAIGPDTSERIIREEIRRVADEAGISSADQARALAVRYGEAARRFPAVQNDLRALEVHAAQLDAAKAAERGAVSAKATPEEVASVKERHALHDAILASPMGKIADPNVDPGSFIGGLMRRQDDGRQLRTLFSQIKDVPEAVNGFRRALGDYIASAGKGNNFTASGDLIPSINKTRQAIAQVSARAGGVLTTQQKAVLQNINRELESANFAATAAKPAGSETELNRTFKGLLHFVPGSGVVKNVLSKVVEAMGNREEVHKLITQAILDPDFAATLLKPQTAQRLSSTASILDSARFAMPATIASVANDVRPLGSMLQDRLNDAAHLSTPIAAQNENNGGQQPPKNGKLHDTPAYQAWLTKYGIREDPTYDTRAAFEAGLVPDARGHLNDQFKLPTHPTFSDESIHNGQDGKIGGKWIQTAPPSKLMPEGAWTFKASPWNEKNMTRAALRRYFDTTEPGSTIEFSNGEKYTGKKARWNFNDATARQPASQ